MIAILSDFQDSEYLGIMKGVIYTIKSDSQIVDLNNRIIPQNIKEGSWILLNSYKYFPKNTIFLCVVDPGVGTKRNPIAIKTKNYFFVGPDNGLMYPAAHKDKIMDTIKLKKDKNVSKTFHGRDIFAKAAAKLDNMVNMKKLGSKTNIKSKLNFYLKNRIGEIVRIDSFGNIITNLRPLNKNSYTIFYNNIIKKLNFYETYNKAQDNELFLIAGSSGTLEISAKNKYAIKNFKVKINDKIGIK